MNKKLVIALGCFAVGFLLQFLGSSLLDLVSYLLYLGGIVMGVLGLVQREKQIGYQDESKFETRDDALTHELKRRKRVNKRAGRAKAVISGVLCIAIMVFLFMRSFGVVILLCLVWFAATGLCDRLLTDVKGYAAENIVRQALEEVFEIEEYQPFGSIPDHKISADGFGIYSSYNRVTGSDYVRGSYKGLPIEMCDICLSSHGRMSNDHGIQEEYDDVSFSGFWLICDFRRELSADVRLWERKGDGVGILTENEQFNRTFHVESEIEEEAFYILTPHMMEYILQMEKKVRGKLHIRFDRSGKVQIAINTRHDAFEVGKWESNAARLREKFIKEIRDITSLIDELRLVETLYKK